MFFEIIYQNQFIWQTRIIHFIPYKLILYKLLNSKSVTVETRKINEQFVILYNIELLDFTTLMTWFDTERGKFTMKGKSNHGYTPLHSIHFRIENDIMYCW